MATLIGGAMAVGGGMLMAATGLAPVSWWDRRGAVEAVEAEVKAVEMEVEVRPDASCCASKHHNRQLFRRFHGSHES